MRRGVVALMTVLWATMCVAETAAPRPAGPRGRTPGQEHWEQNERRGPLGEPGPAADRPHHGRLLERIVRMKAAAERLGLNDEQVGTMREEASDIRTREIELRAELEKIGVRLATILMEDDPDVDALYQAIEEAGALRTELAKQRLRPLLVLKRFLKPAQLEELKRMILEQHRDRDALKEDQEPPRREARSEEQRGMLRRRLEERRARRREAAGGE